MAGITSRQPLPALGEAIRIARDARGVSQRKLCADIGKSAGTVSRRETGERRPTPDEVALVIDALKIDGDEAEELLALATGAGQPRR
ncbi:helix-turn-helix domain-containing protein, partial [Amycolatopsis sp. H20-H5]|uniref:helix-turn-helix domain-containing protein n=1 Tax=Amycolatopsis sp. H20-H5 TaxID=3046309 RepID=UPI002DC04342